MTGAAKPQASPEPVRSAALHWRLLAALYDLLPRLSLWLLAAALVLAMRGGQPVVPGSAAAWALLVVLLAVDCGYFLVSWRRGGHTLGMRAWRLRLLASTQPPPWSMLLLRYVVAGVSLAPFGLGFLWSLFDPARRSWHDIATTTTLTRTPRDRSP